MERITVTHKKQTPHLLNSSAEGLVPKAKNKQIKKYKHYIALICAKQTLHKTMSPNREREGGPKSQCRIDINGTVKTF
jgi:hypothetical protein